MVRHELSSPRTQKHSHLNLFHDWCLYLHLVAAMFTNFLCFSSSNSEHVHAGLDGLTLVLSMVLLPVGWLKDGRWAMDE